MASPRKRYQALKLRWRASVGPVRSRPGASRESETIVEHIDEHFDDLYRRIEALEASSDN